jgi:DNA-binding MarR family transcriptional regulator
MNTSKQRLHDQLQQTSNHNQFTPVPNSLLDTCAQMTSLAEFKVVMVVYRQTLGHRKISELLSLRDLIRLTGMSGPSVIDGVRRAEARGILNRTPEGLSYRFQMSDSYTRGAAHTAS